MHLFVAVPTHSQLITIESARTLLQLQDAIRARGDKISIEFFSGSMIPEVRNLIVGSFLSKTGDVLLMLDSDQGLKPAVLMRMLDLNEPVVGCFYPRRSLDWTRVKPEETDIKRAIGQAGKFVGQVAANAEGVRTINVNKGFAKAAFIGAGAMMIRREALERMKTAYPQLKDDGFRKEEFPNAPKENWGFFNAERNEAGRTLSEDYSFCQRWRVGCGGEIWADVTSSTVHVGRYSFSGDYVSHLRATGAILSEEREPPTS